MLWKLNVFGAEQKTIKEGTHKPKKLGQRIVPETQITKTHNVQEMEPTK